MMRIETKVTPAAHATKSAGPLGKRPFEPPRRRRPDGHEDGELRAPPAPLPGGGPLALHAPAKVAPVAASALCDRIVVGRTRDGVPEVRLDVGTGALRGTEVRLAAGARGLEATFVAPSEAARRVVEAQLADLARALEGKGIHVARCQVVSAAEQAGEDRRRRREREARDA